VSRFARRLVGRLAAAGAVMAAATAAIAVPGEDRAQSPQPLLAKVTAPLAHSNARDGQAVLTAANLKPGERRSGEVTIRNVGHAGAIYLVARGLVDTQSPSGERVSDRLSMTIADATGGASRTLAVGPLSTIATCQPLGEFAAGEQRTYRFTVAFPDGGPGADNALAGASARVDYEWLETAVAREACPAGSEDAVELPDPPTAAAQTPELGDVELAIEPGPFRFSERDGTARVGIRCIGSATGRCNGRLELERRKAGEGKRIAMAVGRFDIRRGARRTITVRLNGRARRRIAAVRRVPVRAYLTAIGADGRRHRVSYRDKLLYGGDRKARGGSRR
jgi:spore coat-associated protein N